MAFNKGYELKKFEAHWEKLRIEYAAAGMAEDAIQKMYDYDRQQFNSERTRIERTQEFTAPAYESTEEEASPLMLRYQEAITTTDTYHETKRSFAWIGEIEDENGLQRQRSQGRSVDEVLKHILSAKGHLQAADVPCYILKITIYRSDDTMVDKFSQVAGNVPVTNNDPNRRYTVINGYPVVLNFAKEPNPGVFERVRDILLATSYTKKTS